MNLAEFILYVKNQQQAKKFYAAVLLAGPVLDVPGMTEFMLNDNCKLGLMPEENIYKILNPVTPHPSTGSGIPRCELYLYVDDPGAFYRRAIAEGAKPVSDCQPRDWGDLAGYCADPDGHILVFAKKL